MSADLILDNMRKVAETAKEIIKEVVPRVPASRGCACGSALKYAIATDPSKISNETRYGLEVLLGKYLPPTG